MNVQNSIIFMTMIFITTHAMEYNFIEDSVTYTKDDCLETYNALLRNDLYSNEDKETGFYNQQTLSAQKKIKKNKVTITYHVIQNFSVTHLPNKKNNPELFNQLESAYKAKNEPLRN